ncbi:DNA translocase FtsK [Chloroflexota bacterium]
MPGKKSGKGIFKKGLFGFLSSPVVWQFILLAVAVIAIWYWRDDIASWWNAAILRFFGWGLIFVIAAIVTVVWMARKKRLSSFRQRWNKWFGGILFIFVLWGILAFIPGKDTLAGVSLGGRFGLAIIAHTDFEGILRILGLIILGIVFIAPGATQRFIARTYSRIIEQFSQPGKKQVYPEQEPVVPFRQSPQPRKPLETEKPVDLSRLEEAAKALEALRPPAPGAVPPKAAESAGSSGTALEMKKPKRVAPTQPTTTQGLKQVAQDVWKKYGESPDLIVVDGWKLPPIDILDVTPEIQFSQADNSERARLIEVALASYGVEAKVVQINAGPTVTQFGIEPGWDRKFKEIREKDKDGNTTVRQEEVSKTRVKVDRITSLQNDIALTLAAPNVRIEAPVPGKSIVGIEVPNTISTMVSLRGVIETNSFQKLQAKSKLALALGKGAGGEATAGDLAKMPHLLIAGATGSGKTVCLNAVICCLILNNTPNDLRFIMIDPKRVELTTFNSIPHLAAPVIVDAGKAVDALRWLSQEMNTRYQTLATVGARNIEGYNKNREGDDVMPYLVLVIDELADLMMLGGDEVEQTLCRLAQLSRAVGIHLVVATQRPSVDVVTGLIKANFPTRISFAVTSQVDSRTILDGAGAEKLLGSGDMLYLPTEAGKPKRLQGCYVSDAEAERLVYFWGSQKEEDAHLLRIEDLKSVSATGGSHGEDALMDAARQLVQEHDNISTSFLQRRLHIGYPRAARIMEALEQEMAEAEEEEEEEPIFGDAIVDEDEEDEE